MRAGALAVIGALSCACTRPVRQADPTDLAGDFVFPVVLDPDRHVLRVLDPFSLKDGVASPAERARFDAEPGESLYLVAVDKSMLHCRFDVTRPEGASLAIGVPPHEIEIVDQGVLTTGRSALPEAARFRAIDRGEEDASLRAIDPTEVSALRDQLTLVVVLGSGRSGVELHPYGVTGNLLDEVHDADAGFERVVPIDDHRLVVMTEFALLLVERGGTLEARCVRESCPGRLVRIRDITHDAYADPRFKGVAMGPPAAGGAIPLVAVGLDDVDDGSIAGGFIADLRLTESGALELVGTSTLPPHNALNDVAIDTDGLTIAVGKASWTFVRRAGEAAFVAQRIEDVGLGYGDLEHVVIVPSTPRTTLISGRYKLARGDPREPHWEYNDIPTINFGDLKLDGLDAIVSGRDEEVWLVGDQTILRRLAGGEIKEIRPEYPNLFRPCLHPEIDKPRNLRGIALDDQSATLTADCSALIQVRRADLCVSLIPVAGAPIDPEIRPQMQTVTVENGVLYTAGDRGALWEAELR